MPDDETILVIDAIALPAGAGRGITQTLVPIDQAKSQIFRTINGNLVDFTASQFRKYASVISCDDQRPPALNGIWPGKEVLVDCISELWYLTSGGSPDRTVVTDSSRTEGDFTYYRPRLTMMIKDLQPKTDEWNAQVGWTLDLEEV